MNSQRCAVFAWGLAILAAIPAAAQGPIGYWRFNEGSGTTANDATGNGNTGTFGASSYYIGGVSGLSGDSALNSLGGGQSVNVASASSGFSSIGSNNAVTLSMWLYGDPLNQPRQNTTIDGNNGGNRIVFTHAPWDNSNIYWDSGNTGCCPSPAHRINVAVAPDLFRGKWNHYALVKNGNTDFSAIYVNGNLITSTNASTVDLAGLTQLLLSPNYIGLMDDVGIYSRALSVPEIQSLVNRETYKTSTGNWNSTGWNVGARPAGDNVFIGGGHTTTVSGAEVATSVTVGHTGLTNTGNGTLNITSGNLAVAKNLNLGQGGTTGNVNITGSGLSVGAAINSTGANSITGGTLSASNVADRQLTINSSGGNLAVSSNVNLQKSGLVVSGAGNTTIDGDISGTATMSGPLANLSGLGTGNHSFTAASQTFSGYVQDDGSNAWLLIGRGREGWQFDTDGQGSTTDVSQNLGTNLGFAPAAYSDAIVNSLLSQSGIDLTDVEIRLRRAADPTGSTWQEVRWDGFTQSAFTFDLDPVSGQLVVEHKILDNPLTLPLEDTTSQTRDTLDSGLGNDGSRVFTWPWANHNNQQGFAYGGTITNGANNGTSFLWEFADEQHAIPYTEVYIRAFDAGSNSLRKTGSGTLTLNGDNTYTGTTTIEPPGKLLVNGTHTGAGSYFVQSGGTLGGDGAITLAPGASVNVAGTPGIISPGAGYSGTDPASAANVGSLAISASSSSATAVNMGGILQIDIVDLTMHDQLDIPTGQIYISGTPDTPVLPGDTAFLEINGTQDFSTLDFLAMGLYGFDGRINLITAPDGIFGNFENFPVNQFIQGANGETVFFGNDGTSLFIQSTPEPASIALWCLMSVVGLGLCRGFRRRAAAR